MAPVLQSERTREDLVCETSAMAWGFSRNAPNFTYLALAAFGPETIIIARPLEKAPEPPGQTSLSAEEHPALAKVWDNEYDAAYDSM